ncbi:MAG: gamma carbonic anhydrase family protein [Candidatus Lokiarchaeota archaeon]|nr:gamma carbonic anhydrase family protein [Candidatus Lokiarchaeota archaeon]MBD3339888.1 gamma carbonic anhydrase family protein [Candidatus Lokiarchaeota archaeon]
MPIVMPSPNNGKEPKIHESVYIAPTATVIGEVILEEGVNVWFGAVLRGDWGTIHIGKNTSVQENVTIHIEMGSQVNIGANCIIGHHAMIHGPCEIEEGCLVGIGANVLHNSTLGKGSLLGAGAVLVNKKIPPLSLVVGIPADVKKTFDDKGKLIGEKTTGAYVKNGENFKKFFKENPEYLKI